MLLVFWAITPLQSAIFNTSTVTRSTETNMVTSAHLVPLGQQAESLSTEFQNTAYGIAWVNQTMPAFTTLSHTVLPFKPAEERPNMLPSETWTTNVDALSTSLSCTPAIVEATPKGYTFSNGRGCSVPGLDIFLNGDGEFLVNYIGYYDSAYLDWALQNPNCSAEFSSTFLAIWALGSSFVEDLVTFDLYFSNMTSLFCETHYHVEEHFVTVNDSNLAIVGAVPSLTNKTSVNSVSDILTQVLLSTL